MWVSHYVVFTQMTINHTKGWWHWCYEVQLLPHWTYFAIQFFILRARIICWWHIAWSTHTHTRTLTKHLGLPVQCCFCFKRPESIGSLAHRCKAVIWTTYPLYRTSKGRCNGDGRRRPPRDVIHYTPVLWWIVLRIVRLLYDWFYASTYAYLMKSAGWCNALTHWGASSLDP